MTAAAGPGGSRAGRSALDTSAQGGDVVAPALAFVPIALAWMPIVAEVAATSSAGAQSPGLVVAAVSGCRRSGDRLGGPPPSPDR
jgi:hypothetical protein